MADYFTSDHFKLLNKWKGQKRDESNPEQNRAYEELKKAYEVTEAWANEVKTKLFPTGVIKVRKRPTSQANFFLPYNWARIYPATNSPKELAYTVGIDANEGFVVKIDTVGLDDGTPARRDYLALRGQFNNMSPIVAMLPASEGLGKSLAELVDWSIEAIRKFRVRYDEVVARLDLGEKLSDEDLLKHFDGKPAFKTFRASWSAQDKATFCRLARAVHAAGLDWWHMGKGIQVRFGRKNPGSERAIGVLGAIRGTRTRKISWTRDVGVVPKLNRELLTDDLVAKIEAALVAERETLDEWLVLETERPGLWPDQLRDDPMESDEESVWQLAGEWEEACADLVALLKEYRAGAQSSETLRHYSFVTFHQSYGYEEFVEGLRPVLDDDTGSGAIKYEIRPGAFKDLCRKARLAPDQRFAMVIDEINRGNISKIFGELITLIEPDKREGAENAISVTLPYSGESFSVPPNVDIIGTMNTADRSLALLDTALRRRFDFVPVLSDVRDEAGAPLFGLRVTLGEQMIDIPRMLAVINQRIEALYDRDHCIGHAYFTSLAQVPDGDERLVALSRIFSNRILPLLEEYFFEDWQKIRLVLADNQKPEAARFVIASKDHEQDLARLFGSDHGLDTYATKQRYVVQDASFTNPDAYIGIYQTLPA